MIESLGHTPASHGTVRTAGDLFRIAGEVEQCELCRAWRDEQERCYVIVEGGD